MPRPNRILIEGGIYHVYNRIGRGERVFDEEFVARVTERLGVGIDDLRSRRRSPELVRARELLMILGVERYGLKVKDLARELRKSPDGMTQTIARAARRRIRDSAFLVDLNQLDHSLASVEK